jgi:6,7-dimethyl-8-ribityllumazine synthase
MPRYFEGNLTPPKGRFAVCASRFNSFITDELLRGALDALARHGVADEDIDVFRVPGAFELAGLVRRVAENGGYVGVICLGAVIRGGTPHFDYIASEVTKGLGSVALSSPCAVSFGVLTCDTVEQAIDRAGTKAGNKGAEAAVACVEMANLNSKISEGLAKGRLRAVEGKKK